MRCFFLCCMAYLIAGCSVISKEESSYQLNGRQKYSQNRDWKFEGRAGLSNEKESLSLSLNWTHQNNQDMLELSGPLAQGHLLILMHDQYISIDDGENVKEYEGDVQAVLESVLGVSVPVASLRFWMLGVNDPSELYTLVPSGFQQSGWVVRFKEMRQVKQELMPAKILLEKEKTRIKLIIDQWEIL
jgi:outer membrane lipoprotein LolB